MIAMQYSFTLPADYDMSIIERRIAEKGPLLDGFPRLAFKAYLFARRLETVPTSPDNLYAPFYLWSEPEGIDGFLSSPGFAALTRDFGRPSVETWLVWQAARSGDLRQARYATRKILPISPHAELTAVRERAITETSSAVRSGAMAAIAAFDPTLWRQLQFRLWPEVPKTVDGGDIYAVGHVALA